MKCLVCGEELHQNNPKQVVKYHGSCRVKRPKGKKK